MAAPVPLHADRGDGRTYTAADRCRSGKTSTHGGLTDGHLKLRPNLHHLDGRDPRGERLFFSVQLDGHRLTAVIDTGSQVTVLATASARALGVSEEQLLRDRSVTTQGVVGEPLSARVHRFARLDIGALIVRNPEVVVTDLKLNEADIVLGVDFLSSRRLWLS